VLRNELRTGLDVGCGGGSPLTSLRAFGFRATGLDTSQDSIEAARRQGFFDDYILGGFLEHSFESTYDVVVLSHVIEHFPRDAGIAALQKAESLARRVLYIETPNGFLEQEPKDGNPHQRHLSGWFPHDFESRGFTVFGSGMKGLTGPGGRPTIFPAAITRALHRSMQWYCFRRPATAATIAAIRFIDANGTPRNL